MSAQPLILTVDRNQRNLELLGQFLRKEGYETLPVSTFEEYEQILGQAETLALALIDISGFDRRIWILCEKLTERGVPLLVISPQQVPQIQQEGLAHGARSVMYKPVILKQLIRMIQVMMRDIAK
jgi:DNA-binding response OmpR family regulator